MIHKFLIYLIASMLCMQQHYAQTLNFYSLEETTHIVNLGAGWDYGMTYSAGYTRKFDAQNPVFITTQVSISSG